jgi:dTDP-4-dehydrorhamnose reductase
LTIRTSIIGRELNRASGLLEWFIANRGGHVDGWANAIFSGFPTLHLSRIIAEIITKHQNLSGLYHVSSESISKYTLLSLINNAFKLNIDIIASPEPRDDKSLDSTRFRKATGFTPQPWGKMISEMAEDAIAYTKWRQDDFPR